jgi:copper chaperone CopZ
MRTETLNVTGMTSEQCADAVQNTLTAINGVADVTISLLRSQAKVDYDENRIGLPQLQQALANAGYASLTAAAAKAAVGSCCGGCCG